MRLQPNDGSFHVYPPPVRTQKFNTRMTVVFIPASFSVRARRNFFYENDACPSPVRCRWPSHARARASRRKHDRPHQCRHYACWLCRSLPASRSTPLSGRVSAFPNRLMMMMMTCGHQKAHAPIDLHAPIDDLRHDSSPRHGRVSTRGTAYDASPPPSCRAALVRI